MDVIQEIDIVSKFKPIEGILFDLYQIVMEKNITRAKAVDLYTVKGYSNFKLSYKRLKDKLLEGILYNSFRDLTAVQQKHIAVTKKYSQAKILIKLEQKKAGVKIAEEAISKSEQLGILEIALSLSRELENFYALQEKSSSKYKYYQNKTTQLKIAFDEEFEMQKLNNAMLYAIRNKKDMSALYDQLRRMETSALDNTNYRFRLYYHHCINRMAGKENNHDLLLKNTKIALNFFSSCKTPLPYTTKWIFQINLVPIYINQGNHGLAELTLNACLLLPTAGSINWHLTLQYKAMLGFYSNKPNIALQAYREAHGSSKKFEHSIIDQRWKIISAYLSFYHKVGKIKYPKSFRLYRFLNSMPPIKQDREQRANLLILEYLHLLADKKLKRFTENTFSIDDKIRTYYNKHTFRRTKYFLRSVRSIVKGNFNRLGAARHAATYQAKMRNLQVSIDLNILDKELVPYEFLWVEMLDILANSSK